MLALCTTVVSAIANKFRNWHLALGLLSSLSFTPGRNDLVANIMSIFAWKPEHSSNCKGFNPNRFTTQDFSSVYFHKCFFQNICAFQDSLLLFSLSLAFFHIMHSVLILFYILQQFFSETNILQQVVMHVTSIGYFSNIYAETIRLNCTVDVGLFLYQAVHTELWFYIIYLCSNCSIIVWWWIECSTIK